jgi:hypothetical protein
MPTSWRDQVITQLTEYPLCCVCHALGDTKAATTVVEVGHLMHSVCDAHANKDDRIRVA